MPTFIEDGYTRDDGYIAADKPSASGERRWDAVAFKYRFATRTEILRHDAEVKIAMANEDMNPNCSIESEKLAAKFVADHLLGWDVKDRGSHAVDCNTENLMRINPQVFTSMYLIIRGSRVSDLKTGQDKPNPTPEELAKN